MVQITNTTQLSVFSIIQGVLSSNTTLSSKFNTNNIIQYEPKHKSTNFVGFPYIWINVPSTEGDKLVMKDGVREKDFLVSIYLRMEYLAKDNFLNYANAIIKSIESNQSTFNSSGYYNVTINLVNIDPNQVFNQKEVIEGIFELSLRGKVVR